MLTIPELMCKLIANGAATADIEKVNKSTRDMKEFLEANGVWCVVENIDGRETLYAATRPGNTKPKMLMNAHLDVVPESVDGQYIPRVDGDVIYGRGASDCLATAVAIAYALIQAGPDANIGAIFTTDEETGGSTTGEMVTRGYIPTEIGLVLDEDSSSKIIIAQKGILILKLTAHGKGGHSSMPWCFDNPVYTLMKALDKLIAGWNNPTGNNDTWNDSCAVCKLHAAEADNQIPDFADATINIRYTPGKSTDQIIERVRTLTGIDDIQVVRTCQPFEAQENDPLVQKLKDTMQSELPSDRQVVFARMNGATDARHLVRSGKTTVVFGTDGAGCHSSNEYAPISGIERCIRILVKYAQNFK